MNTQFKSLESISKKARLFVIISYFSIFVAILLAILGIAVYKKEFIENPFYFVALVVLVIAVCMLYTSSYCLRAKAFQVIEKIDVFGNDFVDDLEKLFLGPLSSWNRIIKKIQVIKDHVNSLSEEELNQLNNEANQINTKKITHLLTSDRLYVRHFQKEDVDKVHRYRNLKECYQYQSYSSFDVKDLLKMFKENQSSDIYSDVANFAVVLKESDELVGEIFISNKVKDKEYFIGFTIIPEFQRKGYAFEIVSELLVQVVPSLNNYTFICTVYEENKKSINLIEKLEFKYDSCFFDEKGRILVYKKTYN